MLPDEESFIERGKASPRYYCVVPAAGIGMRLGADRPKSYLSLLGQTIFSITLTKLLEIPLFEKIIVVVAENDSLWKSESVVSHPRVEVAIGGAERHLSVLNGLAAMASYVRPTDWVLVHDVARPCFKREEIEHLIKTLKDHPVGGLLATPVKETLKRVDEHGNVVETVAREQLWSALTPQMFRYADLKEALEKAVNDQVLVTDESAAIERLGLSSQIVSGSSDNIKVTFQEDLSRAERILQQVNHC